MKLYFYRGECPNFGDELSPWLMEKVFPNFFDEDDGDLFLGIGSIIFDSHPIHANKIVFGSGYGGYSKIPKIDDKWNFFAVRGPQTAKLLGIDEKFSAGDSAILLNKFYKKSTDSIFNVSFIPHFQSIARGYWPQVCKLAGIHFIDPRKPVDVVLREIGQSRMIITEAMHGAIVSDALRVPWIAVRPLDASHHMKWLDWSQALDFDVSFSDLLPSSAAEANLAQGITSHSRSYKDKLLRKLADGAHIIRATEHLWRIKSQEPMLSSESALSRAIDKLENGAFNIKRNYEL